MFKFFYNKTARYLTRTLLLVVFLGMSTGTLWLVVAAQSDPSTTLYLPAMSNGNAIEEGAIVLDMASELSSSETWTHFNHLLGDQGMAAEEESGKVTVLLDGNNPENGRIEITCQGCAENSISTSQPLPPQNTQDLEITLLLSNNRKLVISQDEPKQVKFVLWQNNSKLETVVFTCTSEDCKIQVAVKDNGQLATPTKTPVSTTMPTPTKTPTPIKTPGEAIAPYAGAPLCEHHDPTKWHSLWNGELGCHYDHEHKDNPHDVDDIFGPVGGYYGGQEISYPWQTFVGNGEGHPAPPQEAGKMENDLKHTGYGWLVRRDIDCNRVQGQYCIKAFRTQVHALLSSDDATVRYHSFWTEALLCNGDQCGTVRTGGHADYNVLTIDDEHVPLASDGQGHIFTTRRDYRTGPNNRYNTAWYGTQTQGVAAFVAVDGETWSLVTKANPFALNLHCPDYSCRYNGSSMSAHVLGFMIFGDYDRLDGIIDGFATGQLYTDRYGNVVSGCSGVALDCVPLVFDHTPVGTYQYRDDQHGVTIPEHDISPEGENWIRYNPTGNPEHSPAHSH